MNAIKNKLHNSRGASMIIALVFMLICLFVGGSVLVAATMNANRMRTEQQDEKSKVYLSQRSAAHLIADELRMPGDESLRLIITRETGNEETVKFNTDGSYTSTLDPKKAKVAFRCQLIYPKGYVLTPLQKLLYQSAIVNYVKEYVEIQEELHRPNAFFPGNVSCYDADGKKLGDDWMFDQFWVKYDSNDTKSARGSFELTLPGADMSPESATKVPAAYRCDYQKGQITTNYDFAVDFGDFSQLEVRMNASVGEHETPEVEEFLNIGSGDTAKHVIRSFSQKTISWSNPTIEKGKGDMQ